MKCIYMVCYNEMKQEQSIIKRVKDVNNWRRDNENNRYNGNVKKTKT